MCAGTFACVQSAAEGCWHPRLVEGGPSVGLSEPPSTPRAENSHPQKIGQPGNGRLGEWKIGSGIGGKRVRRDGKEEKNT